MKIKKSIILILFLFLIYFVSCDIEEAINNTSTATYQLDKSNIGEEIELSKFDLSDLKILVRYGSEVKGEFDVNESMITQEDLEKLNQVGKHTITINYKDWSEQIEITLIDNNSSDQPDQPKKDDKLVVTYIDDNKYYQNAVGKNGNELKLALRKTINTGIKRVSYSSLNTYLAKTDASSNDPNKILLFYTRKEISNKWDSGTTWNKEHVWPRSVGWSNMKKRDAMLII